MQEVELLSFCIKLFKEQGSAGLEQPEPRRASGGAKTVQRTVFRAREMDARVIKKLNLARG